MDPPIDLVRHRTFWEVLQKVVRRSCQREPTTFVRIDETKMRPNTGMKDFFVDRAQNLCDIYFGINQLAACLATNHNGERTVLKAPCE